MVTFWYGRYSLTISPWNLPGLILGLFFQTCAGWHWPDPTSNLDPAMMLATIFLLPTALAIVVCVIAAILIKIKQTID